MSASPAKIQTKPTTIQPTTETPLARVVTALEANGCQPRNGSARCPAHDDKNPSLTYKEGRDGRALVYCQAGCSLEDIVTALGLSKADLFPARSATLASRHAVAKYLYADERGTLLYQVVRFEPKGFCQQRPDGHDGWINNLDGTRRVLFRLPELLKAIATGRTVFVAEGEKDVQTLAAWKLDATCNPGGAGKWKPEYSETLRGARVVVVADADDAGRKHAEQVATALHGVAAEVKVLELPGAKDTTEWRDHHGGTREDLERLVTSASVWQPQALASLGTESTGEAWPPMQPLPPENDPAPDIELDMLPDALAVWIEDTARRASIPAVFVAVPAIVALGAVVGRTLGIRPERFDSWLVVPNLWGGIVAPPGMLKTHAVNEGLGPLGSLEKRAREKYEGDRIRAEAHKTVLQERLAKLKKSDEVTESAVAGLMTEIHKCDEEHERRHRTSDATVEKLGELLNQNPRGLLLSRDELAGWLKTLNKPGREGEREFFLEAWNGTGGYTFDRIGRGTVHVPAMCLSVVGGIQPGKLRSYILEALGEGGGADGLLQRIQLVAWPDRMPDYINPNKWPDEEARGRVFKVFADLDVLSPATVGAELPVGGGVPFLRFAPEAQGHFDAWRSELERRLRSEAADATPAFTAHISKYRSLMPSLALLFDLVDRVTGERGLTGGVSKEALGRAAALCEFLEIHARKVYSRELAPDRASAHLLAGRIRSGEIENGTSVRDVYRHGWEGLGTPEQTWAGLVKLETLGWLRVDEMVTGGRPGAVIYLHPELGRVKA